MTTYTAKRNALEHAINDHLPVCAMARRTKHIIKEDKRNDCNNDFAVWADEYIKGMFGNDNP